MENEEKIFVSLEEPPVKKAWLGWFGIFNGRFNHPQKPNLSRK
jgi:hypothetical protein